MQDADVVGVGTARAVLARVNLLEESDALALDIGGSLAKLLYLQPYGSRARAPALVIESVAGNVDGGAGRKLSVHVPALKGTLHFFAFETRCIEELVRFVRVHWGGGGHRKIRATGGGSWKYAGVFDTEIGVELKRLDEMTCTVAGLNFLLTTVGEEVYAFEAARPNPGDAGNFENSRSFVQTREDPFPYLLVNIGSGVSIVKVTGHGKFERVSGSSLGGGTFWGLARMLLNCKSFDDVIDLSKGGDNANVDMLVGDIYGGSYSSLGLDASVIAASFGKVTMKKDYTRRERSFSAVLEYFVRAVRGTFDLWISFFLMIPLLGSIAHRLGIPDPTVNTVARTTPLSSQFRPQDVALSLLRMVSYNIGQIAYLNARVHGLERIYFGGNFIRNHPYTIGDISFAVDFWSQGKTQALFLRHDGYLGAIGAFIDAASDAPEKHVEIAKHTSLAAKAKSGRNEVAKAASCEAPGSAVAKAATTPSKKQSGTQNGGGKAAALTTASVDGATATATDVASSTSKARKRKGKKKAALVSPFSATTSSGDGDAGTAERFTSELDGSVVTLSDGSLFIPEDDFYAPYKKRDEGEWTTVSRVKRKGGSSESPSE